MTDIDERLKVQDDFKGLLRDKDAENVRLRSEINRLRQALSQSEKLQLNNHQELQAVQQQLQQAATLNKAHERHAVLSSATAASGSPRAEAVRLQAELDGQTRLVARLEAELTSHQMAASARVAELQDSFTAKVQGMRQAHQEQLATAEKDSKEREAAMQAMIDSLKLQLHSKSQEMVQLQQQLEEQRGAAASATKLLQEAQQQVKQLENKVQGLRQQQQQQEKPRADKQPMGGGSSPSSQPNDLAGRDSSTGPRQGQVSSSPGGQQDTSGSGDGAAPASGSRVDMPDMSPMLAMMEGQLGRLSEIIRQRDAEVAQLRQAVQGGCDERRQLQQQLLAAQQAAAAVAAAMPAAASSISGGSAAGGCLCYEAIAQ